MRISKHILLFTDFGPAGPYLGQMESVLRRLAPDAPVIHLLSDAPRGDPKLASYLLAALRYSFPPDSIFLAVVDPGVGGTRKAAVLNADGQIFVGPVNGLFNTVAVQSAHIAWQEIVFRPALCSASFHGRDIFAPIAAHIANGDADNLLVSIPGPDLKKWPADLHAVIYFDHYGNALTGIRYNDRYQGRTLRIGKHAIAQAETFCSVAYGQPFWFRNSNSLIEIAVNRGRAEQDLNLRLGDAVFWK